MVKNQIFAWLLIGASLILSTNINAQTLGCFDCSAYQSKVAAVDAFKSSRQVEDFIEVIDFKNDIVRSYSIEYDSESRQTFVMSASATQQAKNTSASLTSQYRQLQNEANQVEFTIHGATDADGNPIPLTIKAVNGLFTFNSMDRFEKFVNFWGERYGISISDWRSLWDFNNREVRRKVTIKDCKAGKCVEPK
ncbi:MAG: phage-related tail fiber protein [Phenylobacterium sp.]|jgi:phage-related tail fiber protein